MATTNDKLNQSLDAIMTEGRGKNAGMRRNRPNARRPASNTKKANAPVGGVQKPKQTKPAGKAAPTSGSRTGESKIIVSNLPYDVTEVQIKEYFAQAIGNLKKCVLTHGKDGKSMGIATITFSKPDYAIKAAQKLNGLKVDQRAMKVEVILGAEQVPVPTSKPLSERITAPKSAKSKPKPATAVKKGQEKKGGRAHGRGRTTGRGKPKTAAELDAEMTDYWATAPGGDSAMATNGGAAPASGADAPMVDDIE